jgi:hypothetical protein
MRSDGRRMPSSRTTPMVTGVEPRRFQGRPPSSPGTPSVVPVVQPPRPGEDDRRCRRRRSPPRETTGGVAANAPYGRSRRWAVSRRTPGVVSRDGPPRPAQRHPSSFPRIPLPVGRPAFFGSMPSLEGRMPGSTRGMGVGLARITRGVARIGMRGRLAGRGASRLPVALRSNGLRVVERILVLAGMLMPLGRRLASPSRRTPLWATESSVGDGTATLARVPATPHERPIVVVAGARPNFVKVAPILRALAERAPTIPGVHLGRAEELVGAWS